MDNNINSEARFKSAAVKVTQIASPQDINVNDKDVEGVYVIAFNSHIEKEMACNVALDVFHSSVPVKVLDDFAFEVTTMEDEIIEVSEDADDFEDYYFADHGSIEFKVNLSEWNLRFLAKKVSTGVFG